MAILFGFSLAVLLLAIGAAIDIGRWLHARDQTLGAVDAAVLAGGRALQTNPDDLAGAIAAAEKFYRQNVTSRLPVTGDTIDFKVSESGHAITATGSAYITTPFLKLISIDRLPLVATSTVEFSKAELAIGGNGGESLEIAVMLDVTGSMKGQRLKDLKDAAKDLVNTVIRDNQGNHSAKIALIPFSEDIRLPSTALNKARGSNLSNPKTVGSGQNKKTYYLSDCVVERTGTQKYTDAAPGSGKYVMAHYTEDSSGSGNNKKGVCALPSSATLLPLTDNKQTLLDKIDDLQAEGGTAGHLGTAWAWYTLSPNWSSLWSSSSQPQAYGSIKKVAILMTDGEFNTQYDSNGVSADNNKKSCPNAANGCSPAQARSLCSAMKDKGIEIYTVSFGNDKAAAQTMKECATDSEKVYEADDGDQLKQAYRDIALKLSSLFLSK